MNWRTDPCFSLFSNNSSGVGSAFSIERDAVLGKRALTQPETLCVRSNHSQAVLANGVQLPQHKYSSLAPCTPGKVTSKQLMGLLLTSLPAFCFRLPPCSWKENEAREHWPRSETTSELSLAAYPMQSVHKDKMTMNVKYSQTATSALWTEFSP